jgi:hypothetical protein
LSPHTTAEPFYWQPNSSLSGRKLFGPAHIQSLPILRSGITVVDI